MFEKLFGKFTKKNEKKGNSRSYVCYVYGQIYAQFLKSNKEEYFIVKNKNIKDWERILNWLIKEKHIEDYAIKEEEGDKILVVHNFNQENLIYKKYLEAIEKNVA